MEIISAKYDIRLEEKELWDIAFALIHDLKRSILEHYTHLQQNKDGEDLFFEQEKRLLEIAKFLFEILGRRDVYDGSIQEYKNIFQKWGIEHKEGKNG